MINNLIRNTKIAAPMFCAAIFVLVFSLYSSAGAQTSGKKQKSATKAPAKATVKASVKTSSSPAKTVAPSSVSANNSALNLPKVTQIDDAKLKELLKANGKPRLVNFWATWCDPCREEFPDLVKIDTDYKGKIDFFTVSLDDLAEIDAEVPKFLALMKAEMPAYILKTANEDAVISSVSKDWAGGLPFTILYDAAGNAVYSRMGKVKVDILRAEIEKSLAKPAAEPKTTAQNR